MSYENILLKTENGIGYITINRPKMLNALSSAVLTELDRALDELNAAKDVFVVIVKGEGEKSFVAGADIKEMKEKTPLEALEFSRFGNAVFSKLAALRQPTIAVVNGFALGGGCELAISCDIRIGSTQSKFGQPEVGLGIIPGFGGTQRLARLIGSGRAKELIYTGRMVKGEEALQIGLLNKVVEHEQLLEEAENMARLIIKNAPIAVQRSKDAINVGLDLPLEHALRYEADLFGSLFSTEDQKEGMGAFVEKREAKFTNK